MMGPKKGDMLYYSPFLEHLQIKKISQSENKNKDLRSKKL